MQLVGVDVGGTFTDLIYYAGGDADGGRVTIAKVPTTLDNQAFGVLAALDRSGAAIARLDRIVHGTTTTTNAVLERRLARCGLITTAGFRDVLELGRRTRPNAYGMTGHFVPLIPRQWRLEVAERLDARGEVLVPLDTAAVEAAVAQLRAAGCEALVIHFLHSYANPAHEIEAEAIARRLWPDGHITRGSAILSEFREYERGTTAAINAAVQPILARYIERLQGELSARGFARDLQVMQGNGGTVSARVVAEEAVKTVMSGPASGVMAAAFTGRAAGLEQLITYDMGGTSTDVALISGGVPQVSSELEVAYGLPIHVPMVDVHTIGAGGGSIARVDEGGLLQVGPESAGSTPGPICYGRGGTEPTISDANLLLGRMNPERLLAVDAPVSLSDVAAHLQRRIAEPLGLSVEAAAAAILRVANDKMAGAIRMVSLSRGHDPRDFALFAFGGAGPLHAAALARDLGVPRLLIPARPGITNALGCVVADLRQDYVRTINRPLESIPEAEFHAVLAEQRTAGEAFLAREGVAIERVDVLHAADMQFRGQTHVLRVPITDPTLSRDALLAAFEEAYFERFAVTLPGMQAVLVNLASSVIGRQPHLPLEQLLDPAQRAPSLAKAQTGHRAVWFGLEPGQGAWHQTPIYWRDRLPARARLTGPAIIEQLDSTTVLEPGDTAEVDAAGNLLITLA